MLIKKYAYISLISSVISSAVVLPSYAEDIYKTINKKGATTFSDIKIKGANKIDVRSINLEATPALTTLKSAENNTEEAFSYSQLNITSPADQTTFQNAPQIIIQATVEPALRTGDKVEFIDNNQQLQPASRKTHIVLTYFDRGTHILTVQILDKNDNVIKTSPPVTLYVFRASS